jgi:hypothetical protein
MCLGAVIAAALATWTCSRVPPLAHTHDSAISLARAVAAAVAQRDAVALANLEVSEQEFKDHVWRSLPAARPERNLPFSYVWKDLHQKSQQGLQSILAEFGGRGLEVTDVVFEGVREYDRFRVHGPTRFHVRGAAGTETVRMAGSFLEQNGQWKVFSFVVTD